MFELQYEPLIISKNLRPWEIAVIPWDTDTFGFGVSTLKPANFNEQPENLAALLKKALQSYTRNKNVKLITATVPADQTALSFLLQEAGFYFIDLSLDVQYDQATELPFESPEGFDLKLAGQSDIELLAEMASRSFQHGRYHQDSRIPAELANRRYGDWVRRCLHPENPQQVLKSLFQDKLCGFSVVELKSQSGYMHLHAIDAKWQGQNLGKAMIGETIRYLRERGAGPVQTRISACNLRAINMHSRLSGHFNTVERLLHWYQR